MYDIAPPMIEPNIAAIVIGNARRRFAIIAGVIKTSGGIKRNIDSQIVIINTIHQYPRLSACCKIYSDTFITFTRSLTLIVN